MHTNDRHACFIILKLRVLADFVGKSKEISRSTVLYLAYFDDRGYICCNVTFSWTG